MVENLYFLVLFPFPLKYSSMIIFIFLYDLAGINVSPDIDHNDIADAIERMIRDNTNMDVRITTYDGDGVETSNPIMTHNVMRKVRGI